MVGIVARQRDFAFRDGDAAASSDGSQLANRTSLGDERIDFADAPVMRSALQTYRDRWTKLEEAVTETEPELRLDVLEGIPVLECLVAPVEELSAHWRGTPTR